MSSERRDRRYILGLAFGALGVVYGDIGTSPLYAFRECFHGDHALAVTRENVFGILSLIFWSLAIIVSIKYLGFILRMDNKGEGGVLALMSLAVPERRKKPERPQKILLILGLFGAALLYGDGMITPAISVLGAVEGLRVAAPGLDKFVIPAALVIITGLFAFQKYGTAKVGRVFGPITLAWFITLGLLGIINIVKAPEVFAALNPWYALKLFQVNGWETLVVLGSVVLVITGGEALYADMGHFGRIPMRIAWFTVVLPGLLLNYFGQGALVLSRPEAAENSFYNMAPGWALLPLIGLATAAAVIASQALISGAYSITMQAIQLGYAPRQQIDHTSATERGQIYMPRVNWTLLICCLGLVLGFQSSSNLASAYGVAVTLTMLITTLLFFSAARRVWKWSILKAGSLCAIFFVLEAAFFAGNMFKILHGGWFPILVAFSVFTLMSTWKAGRQLLGTRLKAGTLPLSMFLEEIKGSPPVRVKGTAVFLAGNPEGTPLALMHNLKHNKVLHEQVVIMTLLPADDPHVDPEERVEIEHLENGFHRVIAKFGFMEDPEVPSVLALCRARGFDIKENQTTFFLSRESIIASHKPGMVLWRERLFSLMSRNAQSATAYFRLPPNRVVELGMQVEI